MNNLDRTLRKGARRIALARLVTGAFVALSITLFVLLGLRIAEKGFAAQAPDWQWAWGIALAAGLLGSAVWVWVTRPDSKAVSRLLDEKLGLKATLATADWARSQERSEGDAWHAATVDEGERAAARVDVRTAIPVQVPRYWAVPLVLALLTFVGGYVPQQDIMSLFDGDEDETEQIADADKERQMIEIRDAVEEARNDLDAALSDVKDDELEALLNQGKEEINKAKSPEELRRAEMRRLTGVRDRLDELKNSVKAESDALKEMTASLKTPTGETSAVTKMADAMQKGDFGEALEQLKKLQQQLEDDNALTEEQKQALAQQLQQLANQLQQAAQNQQQAMQQIAQQAGLPPNTPMNQQALQQAIQNSKNLTQQQKQQLQQQLQQMQKAAGQCQQCAGGMGQLAQQMQQGQAGQQGQAMQNLQNQLSQMEMLEQQMQNLQAAAGQCSGQMAGLGQGQGNGQSMLPSWAQKQPLMKGGGGTGAGSTGRGGTEDPTSHAEDTVVDKKKANSNVNPNGPIIGQMVAEGGQQIRGESVATFREAAKAGAEAASDAIDERLVPKEYEDVVKKYFGGLEREADDASTQENDAENTTTEEPSEAP